MNRRLRGFLTLAVAILTLAFANISSGQVLKGSISGTVTNSGGNVVSGAQIKATNTETGAVVTTTSDASGLFRMNLLPAGNFKIEISAQGLQAAVREKVAVVAGADSGLGAVSLSQTGASETAAESVVGATQSQTTNSFSGVTLDLFSGIQENQGLDRMVLFVPGVINSRGDNFSIINGAAFSVSGLRGRNNDQQIDGQENTENLVTGPSLLLSDPNFVQQYVLVTNNFGPEYGRNAASVVNIITKQGGNAWHGSIYGAENNSFLNALSNSQKQTPLPGGGQRTGPPRSNQEFSGFTIGGPWVKNKVFVFGGFDDQIFSGSNVFTTGALTPTPAGLAQLAGCGGAINATALQVLTRFGPYGFSEGNPSPLNITTRDIRSGPTGGGPIVCPAVQFGNVIRTVSTPSREFNWISRMDFQLGSDTITGRYIFNRNTSFNNSDNAAGGWFFNTPQFSQAALLSWTHNLSAHMVNEARIGFSRFNIQFGGNDTGNPFEPKLSNIGDAFTNVSIGGFLGIGPAVNIPQGRISNTWQAQDNWNYVRGKHQFKAGINWTYQRSPNVTLTDFNGQFRFTNMNTFLTTDQPNTIVIANGDPGIDFRGHDTFLYVGDDWKLRQNLTLNLGLAWSYYSQPANLFHDVTTERESSATTAFWGTSVGGVSVPLSARTTPTVPAVKNNFGPSVGFAYSPQWGGFLTGHGKTVIRGGYRFLYDPAFYNIYLNLGRSAPTVFLQTLTGSNAAANPLPALPLGSNVRAQLAPFIQKGVFDPRTFNQTDISPDFRPDKVHAWSFGLERELSKNSAVEARYVGNHATNLFQSVNGNPFVADLLTDFPTLVPAGLTPCATNTIGLAPGQTIHPEIGRVNCNQGVVETRSNGAYSNYHALQLEFRATNLFKQLTIRSGYTWSKTLDNTSEIFSTGGAGNTSAFAQNPLQTGRDEYSISGLSVPHAWNITFIEQLPFFKEQRGVVGHLLGGWGLSGNYILASGQPYTPVQGFNEAFRTASGNFYDSAFIGAFTGSDVARPFFGSLQAPADSVGIFASDFCRGILNITPAANAALPGICNTGITSPLQLISINALNSSGSIFSGPGLLPGQAPVTVTKDQVRFIINGGAAQTIFGTPFGNVPRNALTDAKQNIANFSVFKNLKLSERASFQFHATALNALNHYNFANVDVVLEDAGLKRFGAGFANPSANTANGRSVFIGGKLTW